MSLKICSTVFTSCEPRNIEWQRKRESDSPHKILKRLHECDFQCVTTHIQFSKMNDRLSYRIDVIFIG